MNHDQTFQRKKCSWITKTHQGSLSSLQWKKINGNLENKFAKDKLLKHISDQEIKESALDNNPAPSNFCFRQKLDDYLLQILSESGKKNEVFSSRALMKAQENIKNNGTTSLPLSTLRSPKKR